MVDRFVFGLDVQGPEQSVGEFNALFGAETIPARLKRDVSPGDFEFELFLNLGMLVRGEKSVLSWWGYEDDLLEVSGWFPDLKLTLSVTGVETLEFGGGELIRQEKKSEES